MFEVKYFDRKAYLAQSPQFYKQMAMAAGFERIFECGPVFRAEKSYTNKHTTEFTGFDLEFSYIDSYRDVMKLEEELLKDALANVKAQYGDQILELFGKEVIVPETPFPVVRLADLYKGLEEDFGYTVPDSEKGDLTTDAERLSFDWVKKHYNHEFLFVTDYSADKRAFYHMRDENGVPMGYDLIWRGTEITTGAQREHRYDILKKQADEKGLGEDVRFYLDFFKYGCPPHGGFGLGVDRLTMLLLGLHIKESMFIFRGHQSTGCPPFAVVSQGCRHLSGRADGRRENGIRQGSAGSHGLHRRGLQPHVRALSPLSCRRPRAALRPVPAPG